MDVGTLFLIIVLFGLIFLIRDFCKKDENEWTLEEIKEVVEEVQKSIDEYDERNKK